VYPEFRPAPEPTGLGSLTIREGCKEVSIMKRSSCSFAWACAALLAGAATARATIVVDAAGGGDFTTLQAAVDAARDGEQILVKAGTYGTSLSQLVISNKGVAICAEAGATVTLRAIKITGLPAGHWIVLRGLTLSSTEPVGGGTLRIEQSEGTVWVEDCSILSAKGYILTFLSALPIHAGPGVDIEDSGALTLQRCTITGGDGFDAWNVFPDKILAEAGKTAVLVHGGHVSVQDCIVQGGSGGNGDIPFMGMGMDSGWGAAGVTVIGSGFVEISGSHVTGGDNGLNSFTADVVGDGLYGEGTLGEPVPVIWVKDSVLLPGNLVGSGIPGEPIDSLIFPFVTMFPEPARSITIPSPLREGQAGVLQVQGQQGDLALLVVGLTPGFQELPAKHGALVLDPTVLIPVALGTITDAGGALSVPFVMPALNPTLNGLTVPMQLAVVAGGKATLEGATVVAWLDSGL
jgi:hypothetical protein